MCVVEDQRRIHLLEHDVLSWCRRHDDVGICACHGGLGAVHCGNKQQ
jgi:hypothetical protein